MGITLTKILADVRSRVNDEQGILTNTLLIHWTNIAQEVIYMQLLPVLEPKMTKTQIRTVTSNPSVSSLVLPDDCKQLRRVVINGKKAKQKNIDEIDSMVGTFGADDSQPAYMEWSGLIEIFPTSLVLTSLRFDYLKQLTELILNTNEISALPIQYHGLLVDYVEMLALRKLNRIDLSGAAEQTLSKMFNDILNVTAGQIVKIDADKERM